MDWSAIFESGAGAEHMQNAPERFGYKNFLYILKTSLFIVVKCFRKCYAPERSVERNRFFEGDSDSDF